MNDMIQSNNKNVYPKCIKYLNYLLQFMLLDHEKTATDFKD